MLPFKNVMMPRITNITAHTVPVKTYLFNKGNGQVYRWNEAQKTYCENRLTYIPTWQEYWDNEQKRLAKGI